MGSRILAVAFFITTLAVGPSAHGSESLLDLLEPPSEGMSAVYVFKLESGPLLNFYYSNPLLEAKGTWVWPTDRPEHEPISRRDHSVKKFVENNPTFNFVPMGIGVRERDFHKSKRRFYVRFECAPGRRVYFVGLDSSGLTCKHEACRIYADLEPGKIYGLLYDVRFRTIPDALFDVSQRPADWDMMKQLIIENQVLEPGEVREKDLAKIEEYLRQEKSGDVEPDKYQFEYYKAISRQEQNDPGIVRYLQPLN